MGSTPRKTRRRWLLRLAMVLGSVALTLVSIEVLLAFLLANPSWLPASGFLVDGMRSVYMRTDVEVFQADPNRVRHDSDVTYLLRPGEFGYANREFDTRYSVDRAGLRDDADSVSAPDVIVIGDSFAMGWGVEQDETFAQVLEERTGLVVLNAGVSSFGTAREVILLRRLDRSRARAIVVQYFDNDFPENRAFVEGGLQLAIRSEEEFWQSVNGMLAELRYAPLDYLRAFLDRSPFFPEFEQVSSSDVAATCLRVLAGSEELRELPVFFFEIGKWGQQIDAVVEAMAVLLESDPEFEALRERLHLVRLRDTLTPADAYVLDPHLRASGHAKIAAALHDAMRREGLLPGARK